MFWNVVVAASNWYGLRAVRDAKGLDKWLLLGAMTSSTMYHLQEQAKHDMHGMGLYEQQWLNLDRLFAVMCVVRLLSKCKWNKKILTIGLLSFGCMCVSESQHFFQFLTKPLYVVTHVLWHIGAFHTAYLIVRQ